jgi:hypothetical protein
MKTKFHSLSKLQCSGSRSPIQLRRMSSISSSIFVAARRRISENRLCSCKVELGHTQIERKRGDVRCSLRLSAIVQTRLSPHYINKTAPTCLASLRNMGKKKRFKTDCRFASCKKKRITRLLIYYENNC